MEKLPAQIGALYFDVFKSMEKWPAQIGAFYNNFTT